MRVLLDTNIFIYREEDRLLSDNLRDLLKILSKIKVEALIHPLSLDELKEMGVLTGAPQSIVEIAHEKYLNIKKKGDMDEHFTVN